MDALDKARPAAEKALQQVKRGLAQGQARLQELGERRRLDQLLRDLGEAVYAEHRGEGDHDAVTRAIAALDAHRASRETAPDVPEAAPPEAVTAGSPSPDAPVGETPPKAPSVSPDAPSQTEPDGPRDTNEPKSGTDTTPPSATPPS